MTIFNGEGRDPAGNVAPNLSDVVPGYTRLDAGAGYTRPDGKIAHRRVRDQPDQHDLHDHADQHAGPEPPLVQSAAPRSAPACRSTGEAASSLTTW